MGRERKALGQNDKGYWTGREKLLDRRKKAVRKRRIVGQKQNGCWIERLLDRKRKAV